jgi:hypothetical protein
MNKTRYTAAIAGALLAAAAVLPAAVYAGDGYRSSTAVTVGYRDYDRGGYDRHHYRHRHHHRYPPYGRAYGYYAPRYPAPYYYRPYYPSYYAPAPRYYYGPDSGWSIDLHYFFRD